MSIACADGFTYVLDLFEGPAEYDIVSLNVSFDAKNTVRLAGETDVQHQQRIGELKKRFDAEKHYSEGFLFKTAKDLSRLLEAVPAKNSAATAVNPGPAERK